MITKINELAKLGDAIAISKSEGSLVKDQTLYGFFSYASSSTVSVIKSVIKWAEFRTSVAEACELVSYMESGHGGIF